MITMIPYGSSLRTNDVKLAHLAWRIASRSDQKGCTHTETERQEGKRSSRARKSGGPKSGQEIKLFKKFREQGVCWSIPFSKCGRREILGKYTKFGVDQHTIPLALSPLSLSPPLAALNGPGVFPGATPSHIWGQTSPESFCPGFWTVPISGERAGGEELSHGPETPNPSNFFSFAPGHPLMNRSTQVQRRKFGIRRNFLADLT